MKYYIYDYRKKSFKTIKENNNIKYFIKIEKNYIEVSKDIFKICKSSYDKIRYTYKQEVAKSVIYYDDIDSATFFINKNVNSTEQLYIKDLAKFALHEISLLTEKDRKIAEYIFVNGFTERETSKLLNIPKSTVSYRKKIIQKKISKKINSYLGK